MAEKKKNSTKIALSSLSSLLVRISYDIQRTFLHHFYISVHLCAVFFSSVMFTVRIKYLSCKYSTFMYTKRLVGLPTKTTYKMCTKINVFHCYLYNSQIFICLVNRWMVERYIVSCFYFNIYYHIPKREAKIKKNPFPNIYMRFVIYYSDRETS